MNGQVDPTTGVVLPNIGRTVHYVSKIGDGVESPAEVLRTRRSTVPEVIDRWGPEPQVVESPDGQHQHETAERPDSVVAVLPDDLTVDLKVSGLGKDYREYAVPHGSARGPDAQAGSWHWHTECRL